MTVKKKKTLRTSGKSVVKAIKRPSITLSDLLIIKDTIKRCGGYDRFKLSVEAYNRVFGAVKSRRKKI